MRTQLPNVSFPDTRNWTICIVRYFRIFCEYRSTVISYGSTFPFNYYECTDKWQPFVWQQRLCLRWPSLRSDAWKQCRSFHLHSRETTGSFTTNDIVIWIFNIFISSTLFNYFKYQLPSFPMSYFDQISVDLGSRSWPMKGNFDFPSQT